MKETYQPIPLNATIEDVSREVQKAYDNFMEREKRMEQINQQLRKLLLEDTLKNPDWRNASDEQAIALFTLAGRTYEAQVYADHNGVALPDSITEIVKNHRPSSKIQNRSYRPYKIFSEGDYLPSLQEVIK